MSRAPVDDDDRALGRRSSPAAAGRGALREGRRARRRGRRADRCGPCVIGAIAPPQSMITLPESPERAAANAASKLAEREAVGDRRADVEPRLEHHRHLVPGLVHLPAVDAAERQHLEDDLVEVERDLGGRDAEDRDAAAVGHVRRSRSAAPRRCRTSRARRRSPRPCRARAGRPGGRARADRRRPWRPSASRARGGTRSAR